MVPSLRDEQSKKKKKGTRNESETNCSPWKNLIISNAYSDTLISNSRIQLLLGDCLVF